MNQKIVLAVIISGAVCFVLGLFGGILITKSAREKVETELTDLKNQHQKSLFIIRQQKENVEAEIALAKDRTLELQNQLKQAEDEIIRLQGSLSVALQEKGEAESKTELLEQNISELTNQLKQTENIAVDLKEQLVAKINLNIQIAEKFEAPLKVGQLAYLGGDNTLRIEQIIDSKNMIVDFILKYPRRGVPSGRILSPGYNKIVWITGIETSNLVDGAIVKTDKPLKIIGTKTYETIGSGTKTVFLFEPFGG